MSNKITRCEASGCVMLPQLQLLSHHHHHHHHRRRRRRCRRHHRNPFFTRAAGRLPSREKSCAGAE